jgi:hypothetical protein
LTFKARFWGGFRGGIALSGGVAQRTVVSAGIFLIAVFVGRAAHVVVVSVVGGACMGSGVWSVRLRALL